VFDHILLLTGGGPANSTMVLAYYIYFNAFQTYEIGYGSSIAMILFIIAMLLTVIQWSLRRRFIYQEN
jgi:multiple sugar transport system permease protein